MFELPIKIQIADKDYPITRKGDYRVVLNCFDVLNDPYINEHTRVYASIVLFYEDIKNLDDVIGIFGENIEEAVEKMYWFFNCGQKSIGAVKESKLIDWVGDEQLICAAINNVCKKEIRAEDYCHWWTFMGYYNSVGESSLATVVSIRDKILKGKKLEKYEKEFKRNNPQYFLWRSKSVEQQQIENDLIANFHRSEKR